MMSRYISHVSFKPAFRAPDGSEKSIRFLVDPEQSPLRKLHSGLTVIPAGHANKKVAAQHEEIFFVLEGHAEVTVGDEQDVVGPYAVVVVPPNVPRQIRALADRLTYLWVSSDPPADIWQKREWERVDAPLPGAGADPA
jgi:mannose-6-phosphate isomerase-like protein (cupin superfamily)